MTQLKQRAFAFMALAALLTTIGCGQPNPPAEPPKTEPAAKPMAQAPATTEAPAASEPQASLPMPQAPGSVPVEPQPPVGQPAPTPDPFLVPEGDAAAMLTYIEGLREQRPTDESREAIVAFSKKLHSAVIEAAERALMAKPNGDQADEALQFYIRAAMVLEELGLGQTGPRLDALRGKLKAVGADDLVGQIEVMQVARRMYEAGTKGPDAMRPVVEEIKARLAQGVTLDNAQLAMIAVEVAQESRDKALLIEINKAMAPLLAKADDEQIRRLSVMLDGMVRRLELPGREMPIEATLITGEKFDWKKYRGKIVLVDFWATWCGPCMAQMPLLEEAYKKYHDRGFEIIGISQDRAREDLTALLAERKIPWPMIYDKDNAVEVSDFYGVAAIPSTILVGPDGKVISLDVHGEELDARLEELLKPQGTPNVLRP